jgi:hypothetical protein
MESDLDESKFQSIKRITISSLNSCEDISELCEKMKDLISEKFGGILQCFVYKENLGSFRIYYKDNNYAYFTFYGLSFVLFEACN